MKNEKRRAFTVVELLIVIAIVCMFAAGGLFLFSTRDSDFWKLCPQRHCDKGVPVLLDGGDCVCLERAR